MLQEYCLKKSIFDNQFQIPTKFFNNLILFSLIITYSCQSVTVNEVAFKLWKLEKRGFIQQVEEKKQILEFIGPTLQEIFIQTGFSYRISESQENWSIYEDKDNLIITGSVSRSQKEFETFTILISEGEIIYVSIGDDERGNYPKDIIPFSKEYLLE